MRRLPPLSALRAFEAAARLMSFTKAADELCVTQTAVSHQMRQLEQWLGLRLFERAGGALSLTREGRSYAQEATALLDRLAAATQAISGEDDALRITVTPSFASCWLAARLGRFRAAHPKVSLRLVSSPSLWTFADERYDLAIRSGLGRWPGLRCDLIAAESLSPVCSPDYLARASLREPRDLLSCELLHDTPKDAWERWLTHVGVEAPPPSPGLCFDDHTQMLAAAAAGHGVGLAKLFLAQDALAQGRLTQPFAQTAPNDFGYWLVAPKASAARPNVAAFRDWVLAQARTQDAPIEDRHLESRA